MSHYVIVGDLETGSLKAHAGILSLSALGFDLDKFEQSANAFGAIARGERAYKEAVGCHQVFDFADQWLQGRLFDTSTQAWHVTKTTPEAKLAVTQGHTLLKEGLLAYLAFYQAVVEISETQAVPQYFRGWMDFEVLLDAWGQCGLTHPFRYNTPRDVRTYIDAKLDRHLGYVSELPRTLGVSSHSSLGDTLKDAAGMLVAYTAAKNGVDVADTVERFIAYFNNIEDQA